MVVEFKKDPEAKYYRTEVSDIELLKSELKKKGIKFYPIYNMIGSITVTFTSRVILERLKSPLSKLIVSYKIMNESGEVIRRKSNFKIEKHPHLCDLHFGA